MTEKREQIEYYRNKFEPKLMVETGTLFGETVEYFKSKIENIISIELSEELAEKAKHKFAVDKNVSIIQGDSGVVLHSLVDQFKGPVLFWLDGHYSWEFFYKDELVRTAKGKKYTPIEEELDIILQSSADAIILIDDARLFNGDNDYPKMRDIKKKVKLYKINSEVFVKKDIIHIIPKSK